MYALKTLLNQPFKFVITICGIALCVVLILFLLGIYKGVDEGSIEYVRSSKADMWVLQRHATNILRSTSILKTMDGRSISKIEGIESVSPVLFILASVALEEGPATLYFTGYNPGSGGGPPAIYSGRHLESDQEIVLDHSFAAKYHIKLGDTLRIKEDSLTVVGLSKGTNMFVIQYAFITLYEAYRLIGMRGIVSCYLVQIEPEFNADTLALKIESELPEVVVYDQETFVANNIAEMESGILPLLFVVALIGSIVLTAILSLILSINVLERRKDFAVMKALGSPFGFVSTMVVLQALILAGSGLALGIASFFPLIKIVEKLAPEVSVLSSGSHLAAVAAGVAIISLVSSIFPNQKLRKIYPMEVFK